MHDVKIKRSGKSKTSHFHRLMLPSVLWKQEIYIWRISVYALIFFKLDTSHIVTPINPLWSHNVAHNCDHATFNVDCC